MKNGYAMVRRLKLTPFELRVAIEALNAKRLKQKANGIDNRATSNLIHQIPVMRKKRLPITDRTQSDPHQKVLSQPGRSGCMKTERLC